MHVVQEEMPSRPQEPCNGGEEELSIGEPSDGANRHVDDVEAAKVLVRHLDNVGVDQLDVDASGFGNLLALEEERSGKVKADTTTGTSFLGRYRDSTVAVKSNVKEGSSSACRMKPSWRLSRASSLSRNGLALSAKVRTSA
jgi:hypothetical protein